METNELYKFIIVTDAYEHDLRAGRLIIGNADAYHASLVPNDDCVKACGGGYIVKHEHVIKMFGKSQDFGYPQFTAKLYVPSEIADMPLHYVPDIYMPVHEDNRITSTIVAYDTK